MLAIVAPGQGAQKPGFLAPWLTDDQRAGQLATWSELSGQDLAVHGTTADAETIRDTAIAQPLLVAAGLLAAAALFPDEQAASAIDAVAGHSVGEFTAAALAGALTPADAIALTAERGRAMAEASATTPTSMSAVIGGDEATVLARLAELGLTPANHNGPGQIVAAGTTDQLAALAEEPPERTRIIPLSVAGAFHTEHMAPAVDRLAARAAGISPADPRRRWLSNADGQPVDTGAALLDRLVAQVAGPVRWDLCMVTLHDLGVTGLLELMPAGTLTGIARRALRGVESYALNTPDQLGAAADFVARHSAAG